MKNFTADFVVGGVTRSDDYYFHKAFIADLWDSLRKDSVLLLSPRRTGKTSVMYQLLDNPNNGYRVIHLNVEDLGTAAEFYLSLINAINDHQPGYMKKLVSSWGLLKGIASRFEEISLLDFKIKLRQADNWEQNWKQLAQELIAQVIAANEPVLFIIDELPDMLTTMAGHSPDALKNFLHQFRAVRINHKASNNIRWLVGGSVNIRGTLDELGLINQINDLKTESLPSITKKEVEGFVSKMLKDRQVAYDESLIPRICELLGEPIAYFLQLFTQELFRYWRREKPTELNAHHADKVFQQALLGEAAQDKLQHYHSRIQLHYPSGDQEVAYLLLDALSKSEQGISEQGLFLIYQQHQSRQSGQTNTRTMQKAFKHLLLRLESDFYISTSNDGRYTFTSFLLKTWWNKKWAYDLGKGANNES